MHHRPSLPTSTTTTSNPPIPSFPQAPSTTIITTHHYHHPMDQIHHYPHIMDRSTCRAPECQRSNGGRGIKRRIVKIMGHKMIISRRRRMSRRIVPILHSCACFHQQEQSYNSSSLVMTKSMMVFVKVCVDVASMLSCRMQAAI